jgi:hypothetical protein
VATALFPKRVDLNDASIAELTELFNDSAADLQGYILLLGGVQLAKGNVAHVRALIQQRLEKLGVDAGNWISKNVPAQYVRGMADAAAQQSHFGQDAAAATIIGLASKTATATKTPIDITQVPEVGEVTQADAALHTSAVQTIMDSMGANFESSIAAMARSADQTISSIQALDIRRTIALAADAGADVASISAQIADLLQENGISALVDAAGRAWAPDTYANMLVRTQLMIARNSGMMNAQTAVGNDLVEVSSHGATDVCGDWEGEILSITGNTPGYSTVDEATDDGLFHPNCQHSLDSVDPDQYPTGS